MIFIQYILTYLRTFSGEKKLFSAKCIKSNLYQNWVINTKHRNFQYFHILCGHEPLIVELISASKVIIGNDLAITLMYTFLFSHPLTSILKEFEREIIVEYKDVIILPESNIKQKSFTYKICSRTVLGAISTLKSVCSGECGLLKVRSKDYVKCMYTCRKKRW